MEHPSPLRGAEPGNLPPHTFLLELFHIISESLAHFGNGFIFQNQAAFRNSVKLITRCRCVDLYLVKLY